jgi:hypothetical protein
MRKLGKPAKERERQRIRQSCHTDRVTLLGKLANSLTVRALKIANGRKI